MGILNKLKTKKIEADENYDKMKEDITTGMSLMCKDCQKKFKRWLLKFVVSPNKESKVDQYKEILCEACKEKFV